MNPDELKLIAGFLMSYQRGEVGWDSYRLKVPSELLAKFEKMILECRKNGFVNPVAFISPEGQYKITWLQILSANPGDKCTMCINKPCAGKDDVKGAFRRCWEKQQGGRS